MRNPLLQMLQCHTPFDAHDRTMIDGLIRDPVDGRPGDHLAREGARADKLHVLLSGWAFRYKTCAEGNRQIVGFLLPGDMCDIDGHLLDRCDHSMALLTDAKYAVTVRSDIDRVASASPAITAAFGWSAMVDTSILREWLIDIGQRTSYQRIAHLFCELWLRLCMVDETVDHAFHLPLTQEQLGDTVGLTPVRINRTLQRMREERLISLKSKSLEIHDIDRLRDISGFEPNYLHFDRQSEPK